MRYARVCCAGKVTLRKSFEFVSVEQPEDGHQIRLRLDRDDVRTEPAEHPDPVADVRPQVEGQVAG